VRNRPLNNFPFAKCRRIVINSQPNTKPGNALKVKLRKLTTPVAVPSNWGGSASIDTVSPLRPRHQQARGYALIIGQTFTKGRSLFRILGCIKSRELYRIQQFLDLSFSQNLFLANDLEPFLSCEMKRRVSLSRL